MDLFHTLRQSGYRLLKQLSHQLTRLVAPNCCLLCDRFGYEGEDAWLCPDCENRLPYIEAPFCQRCGSPGLASSQCPECLRHPHGFDQHRSLLQLNANVERLVHAFKYQGKRALLDSWRRWLRQKPLLVEWLATAEAVIPLPLHPMRLRQRGYNQAHLLATVIAKELGRPCLAQALVKTRQTPTQTSLSRRARLNGLRDAFATTRAAADLHGTVLLVDDVITTGGTLTAAASVLKQLQAIDRVHAFTLARTPRYRST